MALSKCDECGKEISDKASTCPHCGAPTTSATNLPPTSGAQCSRCGTPYITEQKTSTSAVLILTVPMFIGGAITMMSNFIIGGAIILAAFLIDYMGRKKKTVLICPKCRFEPY